MPKKLTAEDKYYREQSEKQFMSFVIARSMMNGWKHYHPPDNKPDKNGRVQYGIVKGFPDLTLVKGKRLVFVELKTETGRLMAEQKEWLALLEATGAECYVWRPSMWKDVEEFLSEEQTSIRDVEPCACGCYSEEENK